ncbi:zona pellucida glycoprotein d isoform X1 [Xiphophorus hellerii]|uniref:zona pellucida glycoprotein d isoform X1 n=1 Tax=Xiphophorus hellerii TaxID=8084 RepID=UPI0013B3BAC9|nr:uromodulin-like isoform X1 [Xiphophorus hellerii]XP_032402366.1 uromodulin-like isoform X1 [Xiphophorus hellerii]
MAPLGLKLILIGFMCLRVEGSCSVENCRDPRTCVLSADRRSCRCAAGLYGSNCGHSAQLKVLCGRDFMSIRAAEDFFSYLKVPLESLHLPNRSCRAQREVIAGTPFFMFRTSREKYLACGGKPLQKNSTHLLYSLTVQSEPQVSGNIIRDPAIKMDFTCVYPNLRRVSLPFPVRPISSQMVMQVEETDATIQMLLFADSSFSRAFSGTPTIELRDPVHVEVSVAEPADFFLLRVDDCWASRSPQPNATGLLHSLVQNGCVADPTVTFLPLAEDRAGPNGRSSGVRFRFQMFRFTAGPAEFYLHCSVQLCEPDDQPSCLPSCGAIRKREAVRPLPSRGLLSYGPIRVEVPDRPVSNVLTAAVLPVAAVWTLGFFLTLLIIVAKAGRRRVPEPDGP